MLRQCLEHGYFRGENCGECNEKGRFLMNSDELDRLGRIMAGVLRHFPERFNLDMDDKGFVDISQMIDAVKRRRNQFHWLKPHHIIAIVDTDPKGRYQIKEDLLRATYGHSIDVELDFSVDDIPDNLFYPTTQEELDMLMETGLLPSDRKSVHLSQTMNDALVAGQHRVKDPIILEIDAKGCMDDGIMIQHAGTTVYITKEVPPKFIKVLDPEPMDEDDSNSEDEPEEADPEVLNQDDNGEEEEQEELKEVEEVVEVKEEDESSPAEETSEPAHSSSPDIDGGGTAPPGDGDRNPEEEPEESEDVTETPEEEVPEVEETPEE